MSAKLLSFLSAGQEAQVTRDFKEKPSVQQGAKVVRDSKVTRDCQATKKLMRTKESVIIGGKAGLDLGSVEVGTSRRRATHLYLDFDIFGWFFVAPFMYGLRKANLKEKFRAVTKIEAWEESREIVSHFLKDCRVKHERFIETVKNAEPRLSGKRFRNLMFEIFIGKETVKSAANKIEDPKLRSQFHKKRIGQPALVEMIRREARKYLKEKNERKRQASYRARDHERIQALWKRHGVVMGMLKSLGVDPIANITSALNLVGVKPITKFCKKTYAKVCTRFFDADRAEKLISRMAVKFTDEEKAQWKGVDRVERLRRQLELVVAKGVDFKDRAVVRRDNDVLTPAAVEAINDKMIRHQKYLAMRERREKERAADKAARAESQRLSKIANEEYAEQLFETHGVDGLKKVWITGQVREHYKTLIMRHKALHPLEKRIQIDEATAGIVTRVNKRTTTRRVRQIVPKSEKIRLIKRLPEAQVVVEQTVPVATDFPEMGVKVDADPLKMRHPELKITPHKNNDPTPGEAEEESQDRLHTKDVYPHCDLYYSKNGSYIKFDDGERTARPAHATKKLVGEDEIFDYYIKNLTLANVQFGVVQVGARKNNTYKVMHQCMLVPDKDKKKWYKGQSFRTFTRYVSGTPLYNLGGEICGFITCSYKDESGRYVYGFCDGRSKLADADDLKFLRQATQYHGTPLRIVLLLLGLFVVQAQSRGVDNLQGVDPRYVQHCFENTCPQGAKQEYCASKKIFYEYFPTIGKRCNYRPDNSQPKVVTQSMIMEEPIVGSKMLSLSFNRHEAHAINRLMNATEYLDRDVLAFSSELEAYIDEERKRDISGQFKIHDAYDYYDMSMKMVEVYKIDNDKIGHEVKDVIHWLRHLKSAAEKVKALGLSFVDMPDRVQGLTSEIHLLTKREHEYKEKERRLAMIENRLEEAINKIQNVRDQLGNIKKKIQLLIEDFETLATEISIMYRLVEIKFAPVNNDDIPLDEMKGRELDELFKEFSKKLKYETARVSEMRQLLAVSARGTSKDEIISILHRSKRAMDIQKPQQVVCGNLTFVKVEKECNTEYLQGDHESTTCFCWVNMESNKKICFGNTTSLVDMDDMDKEVGDCLIKRIGAFFPWYVARTKEGMCKIHHEDVGDFYDRYYSCLDHNSNGYNVTDKKIDEFGRIWWDAVNIVNTRYFLLGVFAIVSIVVVAETQGTIVAIAVAMIIMVPVAVLADEEINCEVDALIYEARRISEQGEKNVYAINGNFRPGSCFHAGNFTVNIDVIRVKYPLQSRGVTPRKLTMDSIMDYGCPGGKGHSICESKLKLPNTEDSVCLDECRGVTNVGGHNCFLPGEIWVHHHICFKPNGTASVYEVVPGKSAIDIEIKISSYNGISKISVDDVTHVNKYHGVTIRNIHIKEGGYPRFLIHESKIDYVTDNVMFGNDICYYANPPRTDRFRDKDCLKLVVGDGYSQVYEWRRPNLIEWESTDFLQPFGKVYGHSAEIETVRGEPQAIIIQRDVMSAEFEVEAPIKTTLMNWCEIKSVKLVQVTQGVSNFFSYSDVTFSVNHRNDGPCRVLVSCDSCYMASTKVGVVTQGQITFKVLCGLLLASNCSLISETGQFDVEVDGLARNPNLVLTTNYEKIVKIFDDSAVVNFFKNVFGTLSRMFKNFLSVFGLDWQIIFKVILAVFCIIVAMQYMAGGHYLVATCFAIAGVLPFLYGVSAFRGDGEYNRAVVLYRMMKSLPSLITIALMILVAEKVALKTLDKIVSLKWIWAFVLPTMIFEVSNDLAVVISSAHRTGRMIKKMCASTYERVFTRMEMLTTVIVYFSAYYLFGYYGIASVAVVMNLMFLRSLYSIVINKTVIQWDTMSFWTSAPVARWWWKVEKEEVDTRYRENLLNPKHSVITRYDIVKFAGGSMTESEAMSAFDNYGFGEGHWLNVPLYKGGKLVCYMTQIFGVRVTAGHAISDKQSDNDVYVSGVPSEDLKFVYKKSEEWLQSRDIDERGFLWDRRFFRSEGTNFQTAQPGFSGTLFEKEDGTFVMYRGQYDEQDISVDEFTISSVVEHNGTHIVDIDYVKRVTSRYGDMFNIPVTYNGSQVCYVTKLKGNLIGANHCFGLRRKDDVFNESRCKVVEHPGSLCIATLPNGVAHWDSQGAFKIVDGEMSRLEKGDSGMVFVTKSGDIVIYRGIYNRRAVCCRTKCECEEHADTVLEVISGDTTTTVHEDGKLVMKLAKDPPKNILPKEKKNEGAKKKEVPKQEPVRKGPKENYRSAVRPTEVDFAGKKVAGYYHQGHFSKNIDKDLEKVKAPKISSVDPTKTLAVQKKKIFCDEVKKIFEAHNKKGQWWEKTEKNDAPATIANFIRHTVNKDANCKGELKRWAAKRSVEIGMTKKIAGDYEFIAAVNDVLVSRSYERALEKHFKKEKILFDTKEVKLISGAVIKKPIVLRPTETKVEEHMADIDDEEQIDGEKVFLDGEDTDDEDIVTLSYPMIWSDVIQAVPEGETIKAGNDPLWSASMINKYWNGQVEDKLKPYQPFIDKLDYDNAEKMAMYFAIQLVYDPDMTVEACAFLDQYLKAVPDSKDISKVKMKHEKVSPSLICCMAYFFRKNVFKEQEIIDECENKTRETLISVKEIGYTEMSKWFEKWFEKNIRKDKKRVESQVDQDAEYERVTRDSTNTILGLMTNCEYGIDRSYDAARRVKNPFKLASVIVTPFNNDNITILTAFQSTNKGFGVVYGGCFYSATHVVGNRMIVFRYNGTTQNSFAEPGEQSLQVFEYISKPTEVMNKRGGDLVVHQMRSNPESLRKPVKGQIYIVINPIKKQFVTVMCMESEVTHESNESVKVATFCHVDISGGTPEVIDAIRNMRGWSGSPILDFQGHVVGIWGCSHFVASTHGQIEVCEAARPHLSEERRTMEKCAKEILFKMQTKSENKELRVSAHTGFGKSTKLLLHIGLEMFSMRNKPIMVVCGAPYRRSVEQSLYPYMKNLVLNNVQLSDQVAVSMKVGGMEKITTWTKNYRPKVEIYYITAGSATSNPDLLVEADLVVIDECHMREDKDVLALEAAVEIMNIKKCIWLTATIFTDSRFDDYEIKNVRSKNLRFATLDIWEKCNDQEKYIKLYDNDKKEYGFPRDKAKCRMLIFYPTIAITIDIKKQMEEDGEKIPIYLLNSKNKDMSFADKCIILSTNIAENSITIDKVDNVVDTQLKLVNESRLSIEDDFLTVYEKKAIVEIDGNSKQQRAGRTARTNDGIYWSFGTKNLSSGTTYPESAAWQAALKICSVPSLNERYVEGRETTNEVLHKWREIRPETLARKVSKHTQRNVEFEQQCLKNRLKYMQSIKMEALLVYLLPELHSNFKRENVKKALTEGDLEIFNRWFNQYGVTYDTEDWEKMCRKKGIHFESEFLEALENLGTEEEEVSLSEEKFIKRHFNSDMAWGLTSGLASFALIGYMLKQVYDSSISDLEVDSYHVIDHDNLDRYLAGKLYLRKEYFQENISNGIIGCFEKMYMKAAKFLGDLSVVFPSGKLKDMLKNLKNKFNYNSEFDWNEVWLQIQDWITTRTLEQWTALCVSAGLPLTGMIVDEMVTMFGQLSTMFIIAGLGTYVTLTYSWTHAIAVTAIGLAGYMLKNWKKLSRADYTEWHGSDFIISSLLGIAGGQYLTNVSGTVVQSAILPVIVTTTAVTSLNRGMGMFLAPPGAVAGFGIVQNMINLMENRSNLSNYEIVQSMATILLEGKEILNLSFAGISSMAITAIAYCLYRSGGALLRKYKIALYMNQRTNLSEQLSREIEQEIEESTRWFKYAYQVIVGIGGTILNPMTIVAQIVNFLRLYLCDDGELNQDTGSRLLDEYQRVAITSPLVSVLASVYAISCAVNDRVNFNSDGFLWRVRDAVKILFKGFKSICRCVGNAILHALCWAYDMLKGMKTYFSNKADELGDVLTRKLWATVLPDFLVKWIVKDKPKKVDADIDVSGFSYNKVKKICRFFGIKNLYNWLELDPTDMYIVVPFPQLSKTINPRGMAYIQYISRLTAIRDDPEMMCCMNRVGLAKPVCVGRVLDSYVDEVLYRFGRLCFAMKCKDVPNRNAFMPHDIKAGDIRCAEIDSTVWMGVFNKSETKMLLLIVAKDEHDRECLYHVGNACALIEQRECEYNRLAPSIKDIVQRLPKINRFKIYSDSLPYCGRQSVFDLDRALKFISCGTPFISESMMKTIINICLCPTFIHLELDGKSFKEGLKYLLDYLGADYKQAFSAPLQNCSIKPWKQVCVQTYMDPGDREHMVINELERWNGIVNSGIAYIAARTDKSSMDAGEVAIYLNMMYGRKSFCKEIGGKFISCNTFSENKGKVLFENGQILISGDQNVAKFYGVTKTIRCKDFDEWYKITGEVIDKPQLAAKHFIAAVENKSRLVWRNLGKHKFNRVTPEQRIDFLATFQDIEDSAMETCKTASTPQDKDSVEDFDQNWIDAQSREIRIRLERLKFEAAMMKVTGDKGIEPRAPLAKLSNEDIHDAEDYHTPETDNDSGDEIGMAPDNSILQQLTPEISEGSGMAEEITEQDLLHFTNPPVPIREIDDWEDNISGLCDYYESEWELRKNIKTKVKRVFERDWIKTQIYNEVIFDYEDYRKWLKYDMNTQVAQVVFSCNYDKIEDYKWILIDTVLKIWTPIDDFRADCMLKMQRGVERYLVCSRTDQTTTHVIMISNEYICGQKDVYELSKEYRDWFDENIKGTKMIVEPITRIREEVDQKMFPVEPEQARDNKIGRTRKCTRTKLSQQARFIMTPEQAEVFRKKFDSRGFLKSDITEMSDHCFHNLDIQFDEKFDRYCDAAWYRDTSFALAAKQLVQLPEKDWTDKNLDSFLSKKDRLGLFKRTGTGLKTKGKEFFKKILKESVREELAKPSQNFNTLTWWDSIIGLKKNRTPVAMRPAPGFLDWLLSRKTTKQIQEERNTLKFDEYKEYDPFGQKYTPTPVLYNPYALRKELMVQEHVYPSDAFNLEQEYVRYAMEKDQRIVFVSTQTETRSIVHFSTPTRRYIGNAQAPQVEYSYITDEVERQRCVGRIPPPLRLPLGPNVEPLLMTTTLDEPPYYSVSQCQKLVDSLRHIKDKTWDICKRQGRLYLPKNPDFATASRGFFKAQLLDEIGVFKDVKNYYDMTCGYGGFVQYFCTVNQGKKRTVVMNTLKLEGHAQPVLDGIKQINPIMVAPDTNGDIRIKQVFEDVKRVAKHNPPDLLMFDFGESDPNLEREAEWLMRNIPVERQYKESLISRTMLGAILEYVHLLQKGGKLVLKINGFTNNTKAIVQMISRHFSKIVAWKAPTASYQSREWYLVCMSYIGKDAKRNEINQFPIEKWLLHIRAAWYQNFGPHAKWCLSNFKRVRDCIKKDIPISYGIKPFTHNQKQLNSFVVPVFHQPWLTPTCEWKIPDSASLQAQLESYRIQSILDANYGCPLKTEINGEVFEPRMAERIMKLRLTGTRAGFRCLEPDGVFKKVKQAFRFNFQRNFGVERHSKNDIIGDAGVNVYGIDWRTSVIGQTQALPETLYTVWQKRLDLLPYEYDDREFQFLLETTDCIRTPECWALINRREKDKFDFWTFDQALNYIHNQGKGAHFDTYLNLATACQDPAFKEKVESIIEDYRQGRITDMYQTCRDKRETKAKKIIDDVGRLIVPEDMKTRTIKELKGSKKFISEKKRRRELRKEYLAEAAKVNTRNIRFADMAHRIADLMMLGPVQQHHMNEEKLYYGSGTGTPLGLLGNLVRSIFDSYEAEESQEFKKLKFDPKRNPAWFELYDKQHIESLEHRRELGERTYVACGDFSGWDGKITTRCLYLNYYFYKPLYQKKCHKALHTRWTQWMWCPVITDHGHVIVSIGQRSSGDQDTSFGNTMLNSIYHFAATARALGITVKEATKVVGEVHYQNSYKNRKYKKFYIHRVTHIADGDDNLHFGLEKDIKMLNKNGTEFIENIGKELRCGTSSGYSITDDFSKIYFCSNRFVRVRVGEINSKPINLTKFSERPKHGKSVPLNQEGDLKAGLRVQYLPLRPLSEILGKLIFTIKNEVTNIDVLRQYGTTVKEQRRARDNERAIDITRGKLLSCLFNYPHLRAVRYMVYACLAIIGDGACNIEDLSRRYHVPRTYKTVLGALNSIYSVKDIDEIEYINPSLERRELKVVQDNTRMLYEGLNIDGMPIAPDNIRDLLVYHLRWIKDYKERQGLERLDEPFMVKLYRELDYIMNRELHPSKQERAIGRRSVHTPTFLSRLMSLMTVAVIQQPEVNGGIIPTSSYGYGPVGLDIRKFTRKLPVGGMVAIDNGVNQFVLANTSAKRQPNFETLKKMMPQIKEYAIRKGYPQEILATNGKVCGVPIQVAKHRLRHSAIVEFKFNKNSANHLGWSASVLGTSAIKKQIESVMKVDTGLIQSLKNKIKQFDLF